MAEAPAWKLGELIESWVIAAGWIGLFLLAPAVPQLLESSRDRAPFQALYEGPVLFRDQGEYSLEVRNNGRLTRHAVEVSVPFPAGGEASIEPGPYEFGAWTNVRARDRDGHRVFALGDLAPGERRTVSVQVRWMPSDDAGRGAPWIMAQVTSVEGRAEPRALRWTVYRSQAAERWYRDAFSLMSAAVILLVLLLRRPGTRRPEPLSSVPLAQEAVSTMPQERPAPSVPSEAWQRPPVTAQDLPG